MLLQCMDKRSAMLASAVRTMLSPFLRECPMECGITTITEVRVSADYSIITVSISALEHVDLALRSLSHKRSSMREALGPLGLRRVPELRLQPDLRSARGARVEELLRSPTKNDGLEGRRSVVRRKKSP